MVSSMVQSIERPQFVLITDSEKKRMVAIKNQAIDSLIDPCHIRAQRQPLGDALIDGLLVECGHESHCEGVLYQFEEHPDMCDPEETLSQGFDEVTSDHINPELIKQSQNEEMKRFRDVEVYEYVSCEEALSDPAGTVVGVRCVDNHEGTSVRPEVRSRLVAQGFATPPLAVTRLLLAGLACSCNGRANPQQNHAHRREEGVPLRDS